MRKLYKLMEWYSLADAASRLTLTLGEPVTENDVLQLCVEGHLSLSWNMRHVTAQEVAPVTKFLNFDEIYKAMAEKAGKTYVPRGTRYMEGYQEQSHLISHLNGPHKLELDLCGAIKDWVLSLITGTGGELINIDGYYVSDSLGRIWRIMDMFDSAFLKERREKLTPQEKMTELQKPINHEDNYFPSGGSPDYEDLGITKADLEAFEAKLVAPQPTSSATKPLHPKERNTLLKLVLGMAVDGYGYDPKASRSSIPKEIAGHLELHGLRIDEDTVRRWLNEAKEVHDISLTQEA
jgi:hypothetical protein